MKRNSVRWLADDASDAFYQVLKSLRHRSECREDPR